MVKSKHQIAKAAFRLLVICNRPKTGDIYRNMTKTKKDFKYSLRQCLKNAEMHKANGLAAALQADKAKKSFWQKVNNKNRSPSPTHWWEGQMVVQRLLKCGKTILKEY